MLWRIVILTIAFVIFISSYALDKKDIPNIPAKTTETASTAEPEETRVPIETTTEITTEITAKSETESSEPWIVETKELIAISNMEFTGKELKTYGSVNDKELIDSLNKTLSEYNKSISVSAWSTDGSKALVYNSNESYFSACTIKIATMLYCCRQIDTGNIDKDTMLTYTEEYYMPGSGKIRFGKYNTSYSIEELITLALSISDNVAYKMLIEYVGRQGINDMLRELGCDSLIIPSYSVWASNSKVNDFIKLWNAVYEYFETNTEGAAILKIACTNTVYNYGTKSISGYDYSHKSGDNFGKNCVFNDAGIVWADTPYIYAIFTKSEGQGADENAVDQAALIINKLFVEKTKAPA